MRKRSIRWFALALALALLGQAGYGCCDEDKADIGDKPPASWPPPMSAGAARTWITLHETTIRPLPDRTPLRQVMRALREATRGKDGKGREIDFRFKEGALEEAEATLDSPVASPFVGQPEVSVDTYLKYVVRQFIWERYVHDGFVVIDGPCDDCEGYATVSAAEAHAWLLLHQVVPLRFPEKTPLGAVLEAMTDATKGRGFHGRGLVIATARSAWRDRAVWSKPVTIVAQDAPIGASLNRVLTPLKLGFRILSDGNVQILAAWKPGELDEDDPESVYQFDWDEDFPMYRWTYSRMWRDYVQAVRGVAKAQRRKEPEPAVRPRP